LDKDATGLLLLTNEGDLSYLINMRGSIDKEYTANIMRPLHSPPAPEQLQRLLQGVNLKEGVAQMKAVTLVGDPVPIAQPERDKGKYSPRGSFTVRCTISEGRFHVVKRMFNHIGMPLYRLKRDRLGPLALSDLRQPDGREVQEGDIVKLTPTQYEAVWEALGGQARLSRLKCCFLLCRYRHSLDVGEEDRKLG
jgi:pseudouridine synthase